MGLSVLTKLGCAKLENSFQMFVALKLHVYTNRTPTVTLDLLKYIQGQESLLQGYKSTVQGL